MTRFSDPVKAWKIVEVVDGAIKTLFHGLDGSRTMPRGVWLNARETEVRDGSGNRTYLSGWHVLMSKAEALFYLSRFTARADRLRVVECWVEGLRPKAHSPANVMLARRIKF